MSHVPGTQGYEAVTPQFIEKTQAVSFSQLYGHLLPHLNGQGCALDVAAGIGRDAEALRQLGYRVWAVEPMAAFRQAGQVLYPHADIVWLDDSLPVLADLSTQTFALINAQAVWHHLAPSEQDQALVRLHGLLAPGGLLSVSLRHGPAGAGTHVFDCDLEHICAHASNLGLQALEKLTDQPSLLPGKTAVTWSRLVWQHPFV